MPRLDISRHLSERVAALGEASLARDEFRILVDKLLGSTGSVEAVLRVCPEIRPFLPGMYRGLPEARTFRRTGCAC